MCEQRGPHACANKGATHEQRGVRGHLLEDVGRLVVSTWLELEPDAVGLLGEFGRQDLVDDAVAGVALVESASGGEGETGYRHGEPHGVVGGQDDDTSAVFDERVGQI